MKDIVNDQTFELSNHQLMSSHNQLVFKVDADLIGGPSNKETREIALDEYKELIERLYFK